MFLNSVADIFTFTVSVSALIDKHYMVSRLVEHRDLKAKIASAEGAIAVKGYNNTPWGYILGRVYQSCAKSKSILACNADFFVVSL